VGLLEGLLASPSAELRYNAVFALSASRDRSVLAALTALIGDQTRDRSFAGTVGEAAREAIAQIQGV
jgi:hypothetical protein